MFLKNIFLTILLSIFSYSSYASYSCELTDTVERLELKKKLFSKTWVQVDSLEQNTCLMPEVYLPTATKNNPKEIVCNNSFYENSYQVKVVTELLEVNTLRVTFSIGLDDFNGIIELDEQVISTSAPSFEFNSNEDIYFNDYIIQESKKSKTLVKSLKIKCTKL
ncbi:hypothetical protein [Halobacteriovorax sp. ZH4_bin.1]|uniref:hypothetical protein n=1 Tax=unclassified Halobacteriovorax TaxID=2639665 RepID=UPI00371C2B36